jgi:hypothetical protein
LFERSSRRRERVYSMAEMAIECMGWLPVRVWFIDAIPGAMAKHEKC